MPIEFIETLTVDTETLRRVHFDDVTVEIGPHEANDQWIQVRGIPDSGNEYYESLDLSFPPEVALELGKALMAQASEMLAAAAAA